LFLFQIVPNAALLNMSMRGAYGDGEPVDAPLALNLQYILTAYGAGDDGSLTHRLMGRAMALLHDIGALTREDIRLALPGNDLYRQIERVRIAPHTFSTEEVSKIWAAFQTNYRLSVAYDVSVVLIDPGRPGVTPLPVRQRGPLRPPGLLNQDTGALVHPDLTPLGPTMMELLLPQKQPAVRLGEVITVIGTHLDKLPPTTVVGHFEHATLGFTLALPPTMQSPSQLTFTLPNTPAAQVEWAAGFYTLTLVVDGRPSNALGFALAPRIVPSVSPRDANNDVVATVQVQPLVRPDQRARLLFDDRELVPDAFTTPQATLTFAVTKPALGLHSTRLRVDGVESLLIADYSAQQPIYDPSQQVTVT
jgi:hypothetical protein